MALGHPLGGGARECKVIASALRLFYLQDFLRTKKKQKLGNYGNYGNYHKVAGPVPFNAQESLR
jgi:hypothetical protein